MSEICIINLKNHTLDFEGLNILANELIKVALDNNVAVFFNSYDYGEELIKNIDMHNFFLMSDSFLYKNCGFLESGWFIKGYRNGFQNTESIKSVFISKYSFFNKIIATIFKYKVNEIELLLSNAIYAVHNKEDFNIIKTDKNDFFDKLFDSLEDKLSNNFNYTFRSTIFDITR